MTTPDDNTVNPNYLGHVLATGEARGAVASEDIYAGNGIKLLAKGASIHAGQREKLLEHKLRKPLEACIELTNAVSPSALGPLALAQMDRHPLLRTLCGHGATTSIDVVLQSLLLPTPVQSLLTAYADSQPQRLEHAVGVAMLTATLARQLLPGEPERQRNLALAGLVHDVGELYIDPACLLRETRLGAAQWRQIATHPLIAHRVLLRLAGAGREVAEAVRDHHERLDGFGYPRGVAGPALPLPGQVLGVAEWLMAMVELGDTPQVRIGTITRLIRGEFSHDVLDLVRQAGAEADGQTPGSADPELTRMLAVSVHIERLMAAMDRFEQARDAIQSQAAMSRASLRQLLDSCLQRMQRIRIALNSTGIDGRQTLEQLQILTAGSPAVLGEVEVIVRELGWRLRDIERTTLQRACGLSNDDQTQVHRILDQVSLGTAGVDDESTPSRLEPA
ncbi:MAG: HD domain-containing protein [Rubrivivax sp.]|nr:HD domain-containing protein [Rubrivivax sp.]